MKTNVGLAHEPRRGKPWLVYWWDQPDIDTGRQKKFTKSFQYKRDAQAFQTERQADLNHGVGPSEPEEVTLGQLLDEFLKARLTGQSPSSRACYDNTIRQLREYFGGGRLIGQIRQRDAESFISSRRRLHNRPGKLSSWTIVQHVKHCRALFEAAVEWGYLQHNPFVPAKRRSSSILRTRGRSRPWHHLTPEQFAQLLAATPNVRRRAMYWLMYGCGLRPGEVYNMTAERIDLQNRRVWVENRPASTELPPFTVKSDERSGERKDRTVPIPAAAIPDLAVVVRAALKTAGLIALTPKRFQLVQESWHKCRANEPRGLVGRVRAWENHDLLNNVLRDAKVDLRRAGIELSAPFTLTTLRKSFAQNHADHGTPPRTLAALLGHSDARTTMAYYNRVTDANKRAAGDVIDRLMAAQFHWSSTGAPSEGVA